MCDGNMQKRYPWTENILELHHLLPLSSNLIVTTKGTSLADVVPLCPNCHRSIHVFYKNWLNSKNVNDFRTSSEAFSIYNTAKQQVQL
jgi:predicted HNH restriction endonuclease